jgi:hypothetical protein
MMHLKNETLKSITNVCGMLAHCWESKEVVVLTYQKLVIVFQKFPHLKLDLTSDHGTIPFMDMLEINNNQVSYLQQLELC